jgi:hypothetical protein
LSSDASAHERLRLAQANTAPNACVDSRDGKATSDLRARDPVEEARSAAEGKDFRLLGFRSAPLGALRIRALGIDCPKHPSLQRRRYREIIGLEQDYFTQCQREFRVAARLFVEKYNRALSVHAANLGVDLCALNSKTLR